MRRGRAGRALPAADAGRAALARHPPHRPLHVDVEHEVRRASSGSGIEVGERVPIPAELDPADAQVEMEAKKAAGYFTPDGAPDADDLEQVNGRDLEASEPAARSQRSPQIWRRTCRASTRRRALSARAEPTSSGDAVRGRGARRSLLIAAAVRERAHEMLELARGRPRPFHGRSRRLDACADAVVATIRDALSRRSTSRSTRAGAISSVGGARPAGPVLRRRPPGPIHAATARAAFDLAIMSRAARCRRRAGLALPRWPHRRDVRALRGAGGRELRMFAAAPSRAVRTIRCAPMRTRCASSTPDDLASGFQVTADNHSSASGPRGAAQRARARGRGATRRLRRSGRPAAGRPVRRARRARRSDGRIAGARASSRRCSRISARSGRAAHARRRRRSATPGAIPRSRRDDATTASCRSTSCRNGSPIR